jgi:hypothetical protein
MRNRNEVNLRMFTVKVVCEDHNEGKEYTFERTILTHSREDLREALDSMYGCWYEVKNFTYSEVEDFTMTKRAMKQITQDVVNNQLELI